MENIDFVLIAQLISTVILVLLVRKWTYAMYTEYMEKRTETVNNSINKSIDNEARTSKILEEVEAEKKDLTTRKQEIIAITSKEARSEKEAILNDSKQKAREIIEAANTQIQNERKAVEDELAGEVMELVSLVSEKFLTDQVKNQDMDSLIQQALNEVTNESA